jgi:peptidyl-prolyl cis-trans isomerase C
MQKLNFSGCFFILTACIFLAGCGESSSKWLSLKNWSAVKDCVKSHFSNSKPIAGPLVALVDGVPITREECADLLNRYPPDVRARALTPAGQSEFIQNLVRRTALMRLAQQSGLESDPQYKRNLQSAKISLLGQAYVDHVMKNITVPYDDMIRHYARHPEIQASHIVLPSPTEAKKAQALLKAGRPFAAVAKSMSIYKETKNSGGQLGFLWIESPKSAFEKTLVGLKDGQISGIIQTDRGYEIIRRDRTRNPKELPSPKTLDAIRLMLQGYAFEEKIKQEQKPMRIEINQAVIDDLFASQNADKTPSQPKSLNRS